VAAFTCSSRRSTARTVGVVLHGIADAHGFHACDEAGFEDVVDLVGDDKAFGGDAGLSAVDAPGADGDFDGHVKIGRGHDDEGIAAT
jgi:hypothetical protein